MSSVLYRILTCLLFVSTAAMAELRLPSVLSDHAVLQRSESTVIWGWARAGEKVIARLSSITGEAIAGADGGWQIALDLSGVPAEPFTLTVTDGAQTLTLKDILIGEVWLSSGQSNMQFTLNATDGGWEECERAANPSLRWFMAEPGKRFLEKQDDIKGRWIIAGDEKTGDCSGVAYYFGKQLQQHLKVPVGLILTAVGGSTIQSWMSDAALDHEPDLKMEKEQVLSKLAAQKKGKHLPPQEIPTFYYNQLIHPLQQMTLKGFIWYHGESHFNQEGMYARAFPVMIRSWREGFAQGDLPFYYCQLPNIEQRGTDPAADDWISGIREAQDLTLSEPMTGQAVLIDAGAEDLHPTDKKVVGERLALLAEAHTYQRKVVADSPRYISHKVQENGRVLIRFEHAEGGLIAKPVTKEEVAASGVIPENEVHGFAISGADGKWRWARAAITAEGVEVWSQQVPSPGAIRYAWANNPLCNLFNRGGLPVGSFRIAVP